MILRLLSWWGLLVLWGLTASAMADSNHSGLFGEIYLTNYYHKGSYTWDIHVPRGFALKLHFRHFDLLPSSTCKRHYVEVFADRQRLGTLCGNRTSIQLHRPSSKLTASDGHIVKLRVRCTSVGQEGRRGFSLYYEAVVTDCGIPEDLENGSYDFVTARNVTLLSSVIEYKCDPPYYAMAGDGDGLFTCGASGKWTNTKVDQILPYCEPVCGKPERPPSLTQRILGGIPAEEGSFPWHVYFETTVCGGALIADQWVLTSASCVEHERTMRMFAGGSDRNALAQWRLLEAAEVIPHPSFARLPGDRPRSQFDNDIALIKLQRKVKMGPTISPVCLPARHPKYKVGVGKAGYVSGFGRTENFAQSDVLRFALVPLAEMARCGDHFDPAWADLLTGNMLCAGTVGIDACAGDGGGAFVFEDPLNSSEYYVAGIVSWGVSCGAYGIYTDVLNYLDWIESTMAGKLQIPPAK